jgi:DNA-binding NarL/FixJ family response regulator
MVVGRFAVPWLALTTTPRGPAWGAMFAAGVRQVLPAGTGIEATVEAIRALLRGEGEVLEAERVELEVLWHARRVEHEEATARLVLLTPREQDVLRLLNAGESVIRIAFLHGVVPATVRSQVKSILRKMEVKTQLAAVIALRESMDVMTEQGRSPTGS